MTRRTPVHKNHHKGGALTEGQDDLHRYIQDIAMKDAACSEVDMMAVHTHPEYSETRNSKLEIHTRNLSYEIMRLLGHKYVLNLILSLF
jgi:ATP-dependent Clp protease ATP-binding subunit ClpA